MKEPEISIGIVNAKKIHFKLYTPFRMHNEIAEGEQTIAYEQGKILWKGGKYEELTFIPYEAQAFFELTDVVIGIHFHWERKEIQRFNGTLKFILSDETITAINIIRAESYLTSVISSEMSATASLEFLKAHAIISRSWLLKQIKERNNNSIQRTVIPPTIKNYELIRWYDNKSHTDFDVCADDHCQRYQGITKVFNKNAIDAIHSTHGQVLIYDNDICDARFSKCCGGITEEYETCWDNIQYPYLQSVHDNDTGNMSLSTEKEVETWIRNTYDCFCNTNSRHIISQILTDYDQETTDFYRWEVHYPQEELSILISEKTKISFGKILDLIPIARGKSGRIYKLKIIGSEMELIIGKELEIRRILSKNHLLSSAFVIDKGPVSNGVPLWFKLTGAGWGHGVGLCQIGAAVMGERGYTYDQILHHYYKGTEIKKLY